ncbi:sodium:solute symporter [Salinicoccus sp. YB14-2]|uniref:sodium:solute symporter family protein n=1 Tax=Salinicoccus sp. YB14-2 TaxID=1572701 RepID=UPI0006903961|nr:sodium:solute symporter family protein [Salinicoccus sp. YB14-2]
MFSGEERIILSVIVFIYFVLLIVLALYMNKKTKTYEDYNVAGRSVSFLPMLLTFIGTGVGGSTLLGYMENGYSLGMGQQWIHITMFTCISIFALFLLKRIRALGEKHKMITIGDFTTLRYGDAARLPTVISILFSYCAMSGTLFVSIATILNVTIGLNLTLGIIIGWILLTIKTYLGGLKAVIWQDVIHGTTLVIGTTLMFVAVLRQSGGWQATSEYAAEAGAIDMLSVMNITPGEILIYLLTLAVFQFVRQDLWQRVWAAGSLKTASRGYWTSMVIAVSIGVFAVFIGVFGRYGLQLESIDPVLIYYGVIGDVFPFALVVVMIVVLLAAVISSADSFLLAGASSIVNDIIRPGFPHYSNTRMLLWSKLSVLIISAVGLVLALTIPGLVNLMVTGTAMAVSGLLAPIMFSLFWKKATKTAGIASMWGGLTTAVIWQIAGHPFGLHPIFIGLPVSTLILLAVTFATHKNETVNI